ncbi:hypothetical protein Y1Q_0000671 [Alligator mississippiensis]|uniref:Cilia-and flagella-associated protein 77 n=2 Tax=Alligator mississippiensis TaxID=8496 RepID=A0A151MC45_ALLMI|nr:hypothetical protein Y1Q_0000671 [Alligator mississippiensis]
MENERVGVLRDTMFQNHLILKPELGRPRQICARLPGSDFVYGLRLPNEGGVPEAIGHWNVMKVAPKPPKKMPRDFISMNHKAVKAGLITAKEHYRYRQTHDIRLPEDDERHFKKDPPRLPDAMTYGMPPRRHTPITDVLEHRFQDIWVEEQRENTYIQKEQKKRIMPHGKVYKTYCSMLREHQRPVKSAPLCHLPSLEKVDPHLSTFRSQDAKAKAFKVYQSEAATRCGILAQGIYTKY